MALTIAPSSRAVGALARARSAWDAASGTTQLRLKVAVLVGAVLLAYHYSLSSLIQTVNYDTPLAYIGLVPLIAVVLAWMIGRREAKGPEIHDRQLDYIIGIPLIAVAVAMEELLPANQSVLFWIRRMDLLSLPLFVAGAVTLLFGTRTMWRQKVAILYLLLAWPWPYTTILLGGLNGFTNITVSAVTKALQVIHLGAPVRLGDGESGIFQIVHHGHPFLVSVVTACSGVDGIVGFLLVGVAFAVLVQGPRYRKLLWLALGMLLLWADNIGRLLLIFWAGGVWGEHTALNILHPVAGLVIFNIGVAVMVLLAKPLGLRFTPRVAPGPAGGDGGGGGGNGRRNSGKKYQPTFLAAGAVAVVGVLLSVNNQGFRSFDLVASASGEPKLDSFLISPAAPAGWRSSYVTEYTSNKTLFGESSRWFRYNFYPTAQSSDLRGPTSVTADVINAADVQGFGAYGVEACYNFHGYTLKDVQKVSLGGGISGETLSYSTPVNGSWSIVYWIWPVKTGPQTRYERVILYLLNGPNEDLRGYHLSSGPVDPNTPFKTETDRILAANRAFLVDFAKEVIHDQAKVQENPNLVIASVSPNATNQTTLTSGGVAPASQSQVINEKR